MSAMFVRKRIGQVHYYEDTKELTPVRNNERLNK